ncbi:SixA phosphatase family protein [Sphingomonas sp. GCM10030256]|uniref:SixA phosphatase family protein n=1 Tax=Sphingomonas sp. GCM10030256 TaxID=3273427 RepID=UPI0036098825
MMKTVGLLRHAKSSWAQPGLSDFDRPLAPRGRTAAALVGGEMNRRGLAFDLVLASPARRVVETLQQVEKGYGAGLPTRFDPEIYTASACRLLAMLRRTEVGVRSVLLVGHNPALQELALLLTSEQDPLREEIDEKYPTAGLALLHSVAGQWRELWPEGATLDAFLLPKKLRRDIPGPASSPSGD